MADEDLDNLVDVVHPILTNTLNPSIPQEVLDTLSKNQVVDNEGNIIDLSE